MAALKQTLLFLLQFTTTPQYKCCLTKQDSSPISSNDKPWIHMLTTGTDDIIAEIYKKNQDGHVGVYKISKQKIKIKKPWGRAKDNFYDDADGSLCSDVKDLDFLNKFGSVEEWSDMIDGICPPWPWTPLPPIDTFEGGPQDPFDDIFGMAIISPETLARPMNPPTSTCTQSCSTVIEDDSKPYKVVHVGCFGEKGTCCFADLDCGCCVKDKTNITLDELIKHRKNMMKNLKSPLPNTSSST